MSTPSDEKAGFNSFRVFEWEEEFLAVWIFVDGDGDYELQTSIMSEQQLAYLDGVIGLEPF